MKSWRSKSTAGLLAIVATVACGESVPEEDVLARAGDYVLTVDEAADLLVDEENLPNEVEVVQAVAELWIDYTLLADAVARDSTFSFLDLEPLVSQQLEQEMIIQLRDSVIQVDTVVSDEELERLYQTESPGLELRASHILLSFPPAATEAQRDSVRSELEALRERVAGGESFETLAERYSQDPGSAARGGDLGFFTRGEMVRPFEDAAMALDPGEVSPVVETPYGFHLIRLEERRVPDFDEVRDQFRARAQSQRYIQAESVFVAGVEERAAPEIAEDAVQVAKELAASPGRRLSGRAADRALVSYEGGAYTAGEYQRFLQTRNAQFLQQVQNGNDLQIENFLRGLVQRELLVAEAERSGLGPNRERVDSLIEVARGQLRDLALQIGVLRLDRAPGEPLGPAVQRAVSEAVGDVIAGASNMVPLGPIAYQLRRGETVSITEPGPGQVVLRVGRMRAARSPSPLESAVPADTGASLAPDSASNR